MNRPQDRRNPKPDLGKLRRHVVEDLGQSPSDSVCKDILYLSKIWDDALYERVQRIVARLDAARDGDVRFADRVPPPDTFNGPIPVALAPTPSGKSTPVYVTLWQLVLHMLVAGPPGKGKTYFCRLLVTLLAHLYPAVRIIVFDPNRSYEACCSDPRRWLSIRWHDVRLNPLAGPLGYTEDMWRPEFVDRFAREELLHSKYLINRRIDELFQQANAEATAGADFMPPSLMDLRDDLATLKCRFNSREEQYRQSALNVLDGRLRTSSRVYGCARGMEAALTDTRVRVDTQGLAPVETLQFFIESILHYAYRQRSLEAPEEVPSLHTLIVVEEAQTLLERRPGRQMAFYEEMLLRSRSLGLGFVFITQDVSHVDSTVLAACSNFVAFGQTTAENKRTVQNLLDLSRRETGLLGDLGVGECFMRFASHPWPHPFIARIPNG